MDQNLICGITNMKTNGFAHETNSIHDRKQLATAMSYGKNPAQSNLELDEMIYQGYYQSI